MKRPSGRSISGGGVLILLVVVLPGMSACNKNDVPTGPVAETAAVRVTSEFGELHAIASAACPPESTLVAEEMSTRDLSFFTKRVQADAASDCGAGTGLATLQSTIADSTISIGLSAVSYLTGHRESSGTASFRIELEIGEAVPYSLTVQAVHTVTAAAGVLDLRFALVGVHEIEQSQPTLDMEWDGVLEPGTYVLEGSCVSSRRAEDPGGGNWTFEDGQASITAGLRFTLHGSTTDPFDQPEEDLP